MCQILAQLVVGVDVCPHHPSSSPRRGEFGCLWMYAHTTQVQVLAEENLGAYFFFLVPLRVADFFLYGCICVKY
jgi:hypothetical protein